MGSYFLSGRGRGKFSPFLKCHPSTVDMSVSDNSNKQDIYENETSYQEEYSANWNTEDVHLSEKNESDDQVVDSSNYRSGCDKEDRVSVNAFSCDKNKESEVPKPSTYIPDLEVCEDEVSVGVNFNKMCASRVTITGKSSVDPIQRFEDVRLPMQLKENIRLSHYEQPTPVQQYAIPALLQGRDIMGCAQTGSGKTAAFLVPILSRMIFDGERKKLVSTNSHPLCLILSPTRELAMQIFKEARKFSRNTEIRVSLIYGGLSRDFIMRQISGVCHILVATMGRLMDLVKHQRVSMQCIRYFILDEADRMLDQGFGPEVLSLIKDYGMPDQKNRLTAMFSATFAKDIQYLAADMLHDYLFLKVGRVGSANEDVEQCVIEMDSLERMHVLKDILKNRPNNEKTLIFVDRKKRADFLALQLSSSGLSATSIHGDRHQEEREEALRTFKLGVHNILVATSVAARGLDIPNVHHVVNYDIPHSIEEYVHRIGRTARAGNIGRATSFFTSDNLQLAPDLVDILTEAQQQVPLFLKQIVDGHKSRSSLPSSCDIRKDVYCRENSVQSDTNWENGDNDDWT